MKSRFTAILLSLAACNAADAQFILTNSSGSKWEFDNGITFALKSGTDDTWSLTKTGKYAAGFDIKGKTITVKPLAERLAGYAAPTYPDYYRSISSWDSRDEWNLANVHDPTVMRAEDGYYYMYQTDASFGNAHTGHGHFMCRRSRDLVNWEFMGATMPSVPSWIKDKLNEIRTGMGLGATTINFADDTQFGYWAPCARKVRNGLYRMYYSITIPGYIDGDGTWSERSFIGLMETSDPSDVSSWEDKGYVITNSSDKGLNYKVAATNYSNCYFKWNAIDPSYIITPEGEHWLIYGSWHSGIAAVQLDPETGKPLNELGNPWGTSSDIANYGKLIYTRQANNRWQASEGAEVIYHDGFYYLFLAYDELSVAYNTHVARARNVDGPYYSISGTNVTANGGDTYPMATHPYKFNEGNGWVGISHCAVFDDGNGNWYFSSQARLPQGSYNDDYSNAIMMGQIRKIIWSEDGWPVVMPECYGGVPQAEITAEDLVGEWELIINSYSYQKQQTAISLTLNSTGKTTSTWNNNAAWSYDAENKVLTVAGVKMQVMREVDWDTDESALSGTTVSGRNATIVFAGYNSNGRTYWAKKK